jgi:hypothetical protein
VGSAGRRRAADVRIRSHGHLARTHQKPAPWRGGSWLFLGVPYDGLGLSAVLGVSSLISTPVTQVRTPPEVLPRVTR